MSHKRLTYAEEKDLLARRAAEFAARPDSPYTRVIAGDAAASTGTPIPARRPLVIDMDEVARLRREADELYERIMFDGKKVVSPASLPGMRERTFTLNGFSKAYGMTGWRVGYMGAPRELMRPVHRARLYV